MCSTSIPSVSLDVMLNQSGGSSRPYIGKAFQQETQRCLKKFEWRKGSSARSAGDEAAIGDVEETYDVVNNNFNVENEDQLHAREEVGIRAPTNNVPAENVAVASPVNNNNAARGEDSSAPTSLTAISDGQPSIGSATKRSYRSSHDQFLDLMRMQILKEAETRETERKERAEDRKMMRTEALAVIVQGVAGAFGGTKKRAKKRANRYLTQDSDSESSAE